MCQNFADDAHLWRRHVHRRELWPGARPGATDLCPLGQVSLALEHSITRMAVATEAGQKKQQGDNRTMGPQAHPLPYGVYVAGFVSSFLAKQTGFGADDLELLWQAWRKCSSTTAAPPVGEWPPAGCTVAHDNELGNAPAHALFPAPDGHAARGRAGGAQLWRLRVAFDGRVWMWGANLQAAAGVTLRRIC